MRHILVRWRDSTKNLKPIHQILQVSTITSVVLYSNQKASGVSSTHQRRNLFRLEMGPDPTLAYF